MYDDVNAADNTLISVDNISQYKFGDSAFDESSHTDLKMTFGAQKVRDNINETGVIDELPVQFIVRLYYALDPDTGRRNRPGDDATRFYIVEELFETVIEGGDNIITAIEELSDANANRQVQQVTYYNAVGQSSSKPFSGVNIVVKEYSDGSKSSSKIIK